MNAVNSFAFKFIRAIVTPVFLLGSLFCVCLPSPGGYTHAMGTEAACCEHDGHGKDAAPEHRPDCPHCGHSHLVKPDGTDANAILHSLVSLSLPPGSAADIELLPQSAPPRPTAEHLILGHPPSSILGQKCVLMI